MLFISLQILPSFHASKSRRTANEGMFLQPLAERINLRNPSVQPAALIDGNAIDQLPVPRSSRDAVGLLIRRV